MKMTENSEQTQDLTYHLVGKGCAVGIFKLREIIEYGTLMIPNANSICSKR